MNYSTKELREMLKVAEEKERVESIKKYKDNSVARKRAKQKFEEFVPKIKAYLLANLKAGDIITCKGYTGAKQVVSLNDSQVLCMCGWFRKGEFILSGYGSSTSLEYVTAILRDGKFVKLKDLI